MTDLSASRGQIMAAEITEAPDVFLSAAKTCRKDVLSSLRIDKLSAIYTIARGSHGLPFGPKSCCVGVHLNPSWLLRSQWV